MNSVVANRLRNSANKVDKLWKDCKIAHAYGTTAGIVGGLLTISGGVATMMSSGIAAPLLLLGVGVGAGGAVTNLGTSAVETSINSAEIKKAEKELKDCNIDVTDCDQLWLDGKEKARLLYYLCLIVQSMELSDTLIKIEQELGLRCANIMKAIREVFWRVGIIAQAASDVTQSSIKADSQAGSKLVGGLIIGVSAGFLMWNGKDLLSTITDLYLVENNGSELAKLLRQKANELESIK